MPFITVEKDEIYYDRSPADNGPVLVLIHGSGGDHTHWGEILRQLDDVQVYTLDLPGHGRSGGMGRQSVKAYAEWTDECIRALGLKNVILAGHSLGGAIVQTLALDAPDWLSRIILVGTGGRLKVIPAILEGLLYEFDNTIKRICGIAFSPETPVEMLKSCNKQLLEAPHWITHDDYSACDSFDIMDRLGEIKYPALVISAADDELTPAKYGEYLSEQIPDARYVLIEKAGHMMAMEQPEAVAEAVKQFVSEQFVSEQ